MIDNEQENKTETKTREQENKTETNEDREEVLNKIEM